MFCFELKSFACEAASHWDVTMHKNERPVSIGFVLGAIVCLLTWGINTQSNIPTKSIF